MKQILKLILGLLGVFMLLLLAAAVSLPMIYDTEDLKQAITKQVHERTGRELRIDGDLDFSVFPWIAVEVSQLGLSNATGFADQDFAQVGEARVGVALMPLLHKQIVVDEITLRGLKLNLSVNSRGQNNWDDLARGADAKPATDSEDGMFSNQRIAGLDIREARIEFQDQKAGAHYRLSDFSMQTGALGDGEPVPIKLESIVEDMTSGMRAAISLSTTAAIDLPAERYDFNDVEFRMEPFSAEGSSSGPALNLQAPGLRIDLNAQTLKLDSFGLDWADLAAGGILSAKKILDGPAFEGTLRIDAFSPVRLMQALHLDVPATADPGVLQHALLESSFAGSSDQLKFNNLKFELDRSHFSGTASVSHFDRSRINFTLDVDEIDFDRYLEPVSAESGQEDVAMPRKDLQDQDVQGSLAIGKLHLAGLEFTSAEVGVSLLDGKLRLHPLTAEFYGGRYTGDINLDSSGQSPLLSLDENIDSVTMQRLVSDLVDTESLFGTAIGHIRLSGSGNSRNEVVRSLNGELGLTLTDGGLEGINIWHEIRSGMAKYKGLEPPPPEPDRTVFSRMQLAGVVNQGVVTTRALSAELPFLTVQGKGSVDLGQSTVNLGLVATVRNLPELSNDPLSADLKGRSLPFKITGSLEDPSVTLDVEALLKNEAAGILLDKLGRGAKPAAAEGENTETGAQTDDQQEQASSKDQIKQAAKGALSKLLGGKDKSREEEKDDGGG